MKKYDSYRDPGIEWIGEIPSHWEDIKIKQLAVGNNTLFLDGDWIESKHIVFDEDNIRYITTGNIGEGKYKEQGRTYITEKTFEQLNCTEVFPGDLIISRLNPPIGRACIIPDLGKRIVTSVDNVILRANEKYSKNFLVHFFSNSKYYEFTLLEGRGATMQRISRGILGNIKIVIPNNIEEQTAIANYLDHKTSEIDELIADKKRLLEFYEEEKNAIINQAVTKGINPDTPMKDSGVEWLGKIPEHWEVKRLKYITTINDEVLTEKTDENFEIQYVEISDVKSGVGIVNTSCYRFKDAPSRARRIARDGDVLVSTVRTYLKSIAKVDNPPENLIVSTGFAVIRPRKLNSNYTGFLFYSELLIDEIISLSTGVSYPAINSSQIGDIKIPCPPIEEQESIALYVEENISVLNNHTKKAEQLIGLLTEYRTALISEVVTGKIKVTD